MKIINDDKKRIEFFNELVANAESWDDVLAAIKEYNDLEFMLR